MIRPKSARFAYLDSLRFFAASLVVVQHLFEHRSGVFGEWIVPLGPGVGGVAIFFFVSGFVIPMSVGNSFNWQKFAVRRFFRIYPLFLCAIAFIFASGASGILPNWSDMSAASIGRWLANLMLVQDFVGVKAFLGVSWTLAIELLWYGVFAAGVMWFGAKAADRLDLLMSASLIALAGLSLALETRIPLGRPMMIYAAVIGFQCYRFLYHDLSIARLRFSLMRFGIVALVSNYVAFSLFEHPTITLAQSLGPWTLGTTVFLAFTLVKPLRESALLNAPLLSSFGVISYSIYLLHPIAISAADTYAPEPFRIPAATMATLVASAAAYHWIEKPGIALGRWVAIRLQPDPALAVS